MSRIRELPVHLTRAELIEVATSLQSADRLLADALAAAEAPQMAQRRTWAELDAWRQRRVRLASVLDKLERTAGRPVRELMP